MFLQWELISFSPLGPQTDVRCQPEARAKDSRSPFLSWPFCWDLAVTSWVNVCHGRSGWARVPASPSPAWLPDRKPGALWSQAGLNRNTKQGPFGGALFLGRGPSRRTLGTDCSGSAPVGLFVLSCYV